MDFFYTIVGFFASGGMFMYPILLVFAVGVAIAIERFVTLGIVTNKNRVVWNQVQPMLANGQFDEARDLTGDDESTISQVLHMGLTLQGGVRRREDIEIAMEESLMEIVPRLEKRTPYVALASSIATLLGLLGTIMGLIQAFTAVANANPAEKADLLSASISVAMNTTAFGLMVAIPLLITHAVLTSRTGDIVDSLEMASVKALNVFSRRASRSVAA
ncbi:MAG: MotA/TolQ/ExbB proton channel family protein [Chromatiales bacterium]|jgi:biopolymer transport protein ExbB|nr:MotA/TolQ/ExbB proton channel family protein [Chromatiales bacterium]MDH3892955.1 MotA/TolQ/ExbB proton channel family protein [Chromatiales bacterium]MDH4014613.1 MotA/TolQ/ExbB proton channel family protein [Chromatiales bacterium]